jgi:hypothetical protein
MEQQNNSGPKDYKPEQYDNSSSFADNLGKAASNTGAFKVQLGMSLKDTLSQKSYQEEFPEPES